MCFICNEIVTAAGCKMVIRYCSHLSRSHFVLAHVPGSWLTDIPVIPTEKTEAAGNC